VILVTFESLHRLSYLFNKRTSLKTRVKMSSSNKVSHQDITAAGLTEADQNINNSVEDKSHQAAGHKANLSNPSTPSHPCIVLLLSMEAEWRDRELADWVM
jgi:hypothetical protein